MHRILRLPEKTKNILNKEYVQNMAEPVFWLSMIVLLVIDSVENTSVIYSDASWLTAMYLFRNLLYLVLIGKIVFLSVYKKEEMIGVVIAGIIGFASLLGSGDFALFKLIIVIIAAKDVDFHKFVKVFAIIKGTAVMLTLLLWRIGILGTLYYQDDKVGYYNTYGFCHRNVLGANVAILCLAWFYLRYRRLKIQDIIVWSAVAAVFYRLASSRTSLLIMMITIVGVYLFQEKEQLIMNYPKTRKILLWGFVSIVFLCILCTVFYVRYNFFWEIIDKIFTKRIRFAHYCFKEYGLSLFGQRIPFVSSIQAQSGDIDKLILDNAYMRALLYYGIIPGTLYLFSYFKALEMSFLKKDCALVVSLVIFAVYGLSERYMLDICYQFPLIVACGQYFFSRDDSIVNIRKLPLEYGYDIIQFCKRKKS